MQQVIFMLFSSVRFLSFMFVPAGQLVAQQVKHKKACEQHTVSWNNSGRWNTAIAIINTESKDSCRSMASPKLSRSNGFVPDIKEGSVHNTRAKSREGFDSNVSFKDDRLKENILNVIYLSPRKNLQRTTESRVSCESGVSVKSDRLRDFINDGKDRSPLKEINHKCSPARSRKPILNFQKRSSHRPLVEESPSAGISCASVKRDNSQGHIANVKDTLPAPKNKMTAQSLESNDSGVSLKSDQSKAEPIDFKDKVSPRFDFSSSEEEHVMSDDEDLVKSPDSQASVKSGEFSDSSLSCKSDQSKEFVTNFSATSPSSSQDISTSELEDNGDNEESDESSDDDQEKTVLERDV